MPKLRLPPGNSIHQNIRRAPDGQVDRPPLAIAPAAILIHPHLAISIKQRFPMAAQRNVRPSQLPAGVQARVRHGQCVADPVLQVVGAPDPLPVDVDADVLEVSELHDLPDVVCAFLEDDAAVCGAL